MNNNGQEFLTVENTQNLRKLNVLFSQLYKGERLEKLARQTLMLALKENDRIDKLRKEIENLEGRFDQNDPNNELMNYHLHTIRLYKIQLENSEKYLLDLFHQLLDMADDSDAQKDELKKELETVLGSLN